METSMSLAPQKTFDHSYFRKKNLAILALVLLMVLVMWGSGKVADFDFVYAFTSIPLALQWMAISFAPTAASLSALPELLHQTWLTILSAVAATTTAAILALILGVLGSNSVGVKNTVVKTSIRVIASVFRNIPIVAWALVLLLSFKQGEFTGFLALFLSTFGQLTRLFLDTFDEVPLGPIEAVGATGSSYWPIIFQAAIPCAIPQLMSWVLYMVETNIRSATLVGMLTGTGIGFAFDLYYKSFRYDVAGLLVIITIITVISIELISAKVRRSML
ncbi:MAG: ABC transporter permease subunit [Coriobacteriia bacterium]|nr:ABC transporter permease subunit [Coriobacteriia bacterium]